MSKQLQVTEQKANELGLELAELNEQHTKLVQDSEKKEKDIAQLTELFAKKAEEEIQKKVELQTVRGQMLQLEIDLAEAQKHLPKDKFHLMQILIEYHNK